MYTLHACNQLYIHMTPIMKYLWVNDLSNEPQVNSYLNGSTILKYIMYAILISSFSILRLAQGV